MTEVIEILKQLGPAGVIAIIAWQAFGYMLKANERKNGIIANHISEDTKVKVELKQSIDRLSDTVEAVIIKIQQIVTK